MNTDPQPDRDAADADTVASRAAQVISSMGADIRALTGERDRYRAAWRSARERAQAYGEGILRVVKDRELYQERLRQAEDRAQSVVSPPATDRAGLLAELIAKAEEWDGHITVQELRRMADEAPTLPSVHTLDVQGFCPACGHGVLMLGEGGHVTCTLIDCPNPSAVDELLRGVAGEAQQQEAGRSDVGTEFVRQVDAPDEAGLAVVEAYLADEAHCPSPETHNWGCGCPSDVAAAIASCPGRETDGPSPCRCPCYGCKHHCGAHDPSTVADESQQSTARPSCPDPIECGHEAALGLAEMKLDLVHATAMAWARETMTEPTRVAGRHLLRILDGDEAQQQPDTETREAHRPHHRWYVETYDYVADEWAPGQRFTTRSDAAERHQALNRSRPAWDDGTPVKRRLVRETTTYTVEIEHTPEQPS